MATSVLEFPPTTPKQHGGKKGAPNILIIKEGDVFPITAPTPRTAPSINGGKRGPSGPLVTTSDEESDGCPSPRSTQPTGTINSNNSRSVTALQQQEKDRQTQKQQQQHAYEAYEHDHDYGYENVASPSGSSTSSGPIYVRQPGFKYHAHEIKKTKKKKTQETVFDYRVTGLKKRAPTPPKMRSRRESLPMKLRALPQSFWKQPNVPNQVSPAFFPSLPPLCSKDTVEDVAEIRPITPPEEREARQKQKQLSRQPERKLIVGDPDLLLKHLFAGVTQNDDQKNASHLKRGRPRKIHVPKATSTKTLIHGDDPFLISDVTDKRFPKLTIESRQAQAGNTMLQLVTLKEGDRSVTLPSLSHELNYSQMLSELAMNI